MNAINRNAIESITISRTGALLAVEYWSNERQPRLRVWHAIGPSTTVIHERNGDYRQFRARGLLAIQRMIASRVAPSTALAISAQLDDAIAMQAAISA